MELIYLDHAATTRPDPRVVEAMRPYVAEHFGNPLSTHPFGEKPREALERAREQLGALLSCESREVIFTSSGSEANNLAVKGVALAREKKGKHLVVSAVEHESVMNAARSMARLGWEVTTVPVDCYGLVDPGDLKATLRPETTLVCVNLANLEIGTVEPVGALVEVVKENSAAAFHADAVQAVGHVPVDVGELGVDLLSVSGHRFYGPKGSGALYVKRGVRVQPLVDGGIQEGGRRAGTEDVPAIVGLGEAARVAAEEMQGRSARVRALRDRLHEGLFERIPYLHLNGHPEKRLPTHESVCVEYVEGEAMVLLLLREGICTSSGSTCSSRALKASHVLLACGLEPAVAQGSLQFTLGPDNTEEQINKVVDVLPEVAKRLRSLSPIYPGDRAD
ncbi:MAG: aminotransferase class V-fold PLP-dependent enzyme [candidate division Zixibacteria bacterium]|nr:aminotransferase class V-fold PLP-dependent enzyme [candidate division Zixibacteria bacterium]